MDRIRKRQFVQGAVLGVPTGFAAGLAPSTVATVTVAAFTTAVFHISMGYTTRPRHLVSNALALAPPFALGAILTNTVSLVSLSAGAAIAAVLAVPIALSLVGVYIATALGQRLGDAGFVPLVDFDTLLAIGGIISLPLLILAVFGLAAAATVLPTLVRAGAGVAVATVATWAARQYQV